MQNDYQAAIFESIRKKMPKGDSLGHVVAEILCISQDAVYRRLRGETLLTIYELEKLSRHFKFSLDALFGMNKSQVLFDFQALNTYDFSMETYMEGILSGLKMIRSNAEPKLIIAVHNTPFLQLLNFPHLVRFKLFFWAKTHLQIKEYKDKLFEYEKIPPRIFELGFESLKTYNSIPSTEIYDPELIRGFVREIYYYFNAHHFVDPQYAIYLLEVLERFIDHLKAQAVSGKKFVAQTEAPTSGNDFVMYLNDTVNTNTTVHYQNSHTQGLYIAHNVLNTLHTTDESYIEDSLGVLHKQMANSSVISITNEKERNNYFYQIKAMIAGYRKKIELEISL